MMTGFQKIVAIPAELENQSENIVNEEIAVQPQIKNKTVRKNYVTLLDKLNRILKIVLKLAVINGYDSIGRIRDKNGNYVDQSNVIKLLNNSMTYGKLLIGQSEFIDLLNEADIDPDLIVNENIKIKLINTKAIRNKKSLEQSNIVQEDDIIFNETEEPESNTESVLSYDQSSTSKVIDKKSRKRHSTNIPGPNVTTRSKRLRSHLEQTGSGYRKKSKNAIAEWEILKEM